MNLKVLGQDVKGNIVLNATASSLAPLGAEYGDVFLLTYGTMFIIANYVPSLDYADPGTVAFIAEGDSRAKICICAGSMVKTFGGPPGGIVGVSIREKQGAAASFALHKMTRSNNREDYRNRSNAQFANFRRITTPGMGAGILYRSSSPIDTALGRNRYADTEAKKAGIRYIINLVDTQEAAQRHRGFAGSYYSRCAILCLPVGTDMLSENFMQAMASIVRMIGREPGPFLIHCRDGRERTGLVCAVLECMAGAGYGDFIEDYMASLINFYISNITFENYKTITTIPLGIMQRTFGCSDLANSNMQDLTLKYLKKCGLSQADIERACNVLEGRPGES